MDQYRISALIAGAALLLCANGVFASAAFDEVCVGCHGEFNDSPYISLKDGISWGASLMDRHIDVLDGDCDTCHSPTFLPVFLDFSEGGTGFPPISCMGCHGRDQDMGNDDISPGRGAGLRQHHYNAGVTECADCHRDADPANYTPVKERVLPPYYFTPDTIHPDKPWNPCYAEDFAGGPFGLDNDGDLLRDEADRDCQVIVPALHPVGMVLVALFLLVTGVIGIGLRRRRV